MIVGSLISIKYCGKGSSECTFDGCVFEVCSLDERFIWATIVGEDKDNIFTEFNPRTLREKKKTTPKYFDRKTHEFTKLNYKVY